MGKLSLSVVIPVYNAGNVIEKTVSSIERATCVPDELILVDDGSGDESGLVCDSLEKKYDNIRVLHQENRGIAEARNSGIDAATGDYICFVDQDDIVSDRMYEIGLDIAEHTNVDIVLFSTGQVIKGKKVEYEILGNSEYNEPEVREDLLPAFLYRGYVNPKRSNTPAVTASIWKCIIRRKMLTDEDIRFKRFVSYEDDYIMMLELLSHAKKVVTRSYIGYFWVINSESESHSGKYIVEYGKKVIALTAYLERVLRKNGLPDERVELLRDQFLFEKTIDVIANAYDGKSKAALASPKCEVDEYIIDIDFFGIDQEHVRPMSGFHRLNELYKYMQKGNEERLISGMWRFIRLERFVHRIPRLLGKLKK